MSHDRKHNQLLNFLSNELSVSEAAIAVALKQCNNDTDPLPLILWQYGLLSLDQLNHTFDWLSDQIRLFH